MLRARALLLDYRSTKFGDEFSNFLKRNATFDHVAVDIGALAGAAGRFTRDLLGAERDRETIKFMNKTVLSTLMRRLSAKKSIALLMDGADPLWKTRKSRKFPGKKFEGKFYRSAASPATYMIEDSLRKGLFDSKSCPPEVVISGPACQGPVESKLGGWLMDLADRDDVSRNDSIAIVGGSDLALVALGATPFHSITSLTLSAEWKALTLQELLEWLGVDQLLKDNDNSKLARVRTDVVLLQLLASGMTTTDLPSLGLGFKEMMDVYASDNLPNSEFLFSEDGNQLVLECATLERLLSRASARTFPARPNTAASDYLEILLQTHSMLCGGMIRNFGFVPREPLVASPVPVRVDQLMGVLKTHGKGAKLRASENFEFGITAAEHLLISAPAASLIDQIAPAYTGGHPLPPGTSEQIVAADGIEDAFRKARDILDRGNKDAHPAMDFYPSHCWVRSPGEKGPPIGFRYHSVNLGIRSFDNSTRAARNAEAATDAVVGESLRNSMMRFDQESGKWMAEACSALPRSDANFPSALKVLTWNVQFSRHSGEKTPLGRPGIDWCSETRYVALADILRREDADIVAMQEVEASFWEHLAAQPFVRENYYLSTAADGEAITPWGVLMLVKKTLNIHAIANANVAGYTGHTSVMPIVTIGIKKAVKVGVGSFHLLAPYNQNNISNRTTQIENLLKRLQPKSIGADCIAMGDFNDYPAQFYEMPKDLQLGDAWVEVHGPDSGEAGYTINGKVSEYTGLIIEPEYFGRADRLFYRSKCLQPTEARIVGNVSVKKHFAAVGDETAIAGKKCPDYLFPSDHFGCCVVFTVK